MALWRRCFSGRAVFFFLEVFWGARQTWKFWVHHVFIYRVFFPLLVPPSFCVWCSAGNETWNDPKNPSNGWFPLSGLDLRFISRAPASGAEAKPRFEATRCGVTFEKTPCGFQMPFSVNFLSLRYMERGWPAGVSQEPCSTMHWGLSFDPSGLQKEPSGGGNGVFFLKIRVLRS